MAGNDLPDIIHLRGGYAAAPNLPEFFKAKCADLTPYLGGSASKDYPNLAAIPTYAWRQGVAAIDGHLYLIPLERYLPGTGTLTASGASGYFIKNTDLWDAALGTGYQPKDADDFKRVLQELNRPDSNQWALGAGPELFFALYVYAQMFGAPNGWRLETSGKLTRNWETPEFKAAVGYLRDLWAAGLYHPNSNGSQPVSVVNGQFVIGYLGFGLGWANLIRQGMALKPQRHFDWILPIAHDGGKPVNYLTAGVASLNVLKAGPPDRITELLRVIDWLAAPFGSQEDLLLTSGIKDQDYTFDDTGNPIPTAAGKLNAGSVPWQYVCQHPQVAYQPDIPSYGKAAWDFEHAVIPNGITDPTWAYYSPTNYGSGAAANVAFHDGMNDIILGRRQLDEYDSILKTWQTAAGEQIRKEFTEAIAAAS
jgi:putative aldouronate transport system substrate-binding protein